MFYDYLLIIYVYFVTYYSTIPIIAQYINRKSPLSLSGKELVLYKTYYCSCVHALSCLLLTGFNFPNIETISGENDIVDNMVILNSLVYFSIDICYCYYLNAWGYFAHHLILIFTISLSLITNNYAKIVIIGLFIAELTNPIQNIAWVLNAHKYRIAKPIFFINNWFYILFRGVGYPIFYLYYRPYIPNDNGGYFLIINGYLLYAMSVKWSINLVKKNYDIMMRWVNIRVS